MSYHFVPGGSLSQASCRNPGAWICLYVHGYFIGKRKFLAVVGYGLAAITKPIFPPATTIGWVFAILAVTGLLLYRLAVFDGKLGVS
ncbi:MAG: hypothetical protein JW882_18345 [Deltaproteobacteria bacterium]|nr:hypothetical protein [Deltaproteobacteria bacterium]